MRRMHAIPTRYSGVQFRSRLEAKWAAMFDLFGWSWEYEPFDCVGIPFLMGRTEGERAALRCLEFGLFERRPHGYYAVDYVHGNPLRAQLEARRARARAKGRATGLSVPENLQVTHSFCSVSKGNRT